MNILIDDERLITPDGTRPDVIVRTYHAAMVLLGNDVIWPFDVVYLDHDLGESELDRTGYDWITHLERRYFETRANLPARIVCVSDNGPGRARINQVIEKLYPTTLKGKQ